jgi:phosphoglycolate phosphatase
MGQIAMRYRLAIFDFDGTLADSFPWFSRVINDVADRFSFKRVAAHKVDALRTMDARELMRHLGVPAWKVPFIAHHMRKRKSRELDQTRLFDGVDRMLRRLSDADVALALVSSNSESNVRAILGAENAGLIRYCECGASLLGKASRFRRVLRRSGIGARDAICIGDEIRDFEAAQKAGIAFGAVTWGYTAAEALVARSPAAVFCSVDEIADRLVC